MQEKVIIEIVDPFGTSNVQVYPLGTQVHVDFGKPTGYPRYGYNPRQDPTQKDYLVEVDSELTHRYADEAMEKGVTKFHLTRETLEVWFVLTDTARLVYKRKDEYITLELVLEEWRHLWNQKTGLFAAFAIQLIILPFEDEKEKRTVELKSLSELIAFLGWNGEPD